MLLFLCLHLFGFTAQFLMYSTKWGRGGVDRFCSMSPATCRGFLYFIEDGTALYISCDLFFLLHLTLFVYIGSLISFWHGTNEALAGSQKAPDWP